MRRIKTVQREAALGRKRDKHLPLCWALRSVEGREDRHFPLLTFAWHAGAAGDGHLPLRIRKEKERSEKSYHKRGVGYWSACSKGHNTTDLDGGEGDRLGPSSLCGVRLWATWGMYLTSKSQHTYQHARRCSQNQHSLSTGDVLWLYIQSKCYFGPTKSLLVITSV